MRSSILCYDLLDLMTYHKLQIDHLVPIAGFQDFEKNLRLVKSILRLSHIITVLTILPPDPDFTILTSVSD